MTNLNDKMQEQTANCASRMKEVELSELTLSGATLDSTLQSMLVSQKDSITTIDAAHFSTLSQPLEESPISLEGLLSKGISTFYNPEKGYQTKFKQQLSKHLSTENVAKMGVSATKSGAKKLLEEVPVLNKVPVLGGLVEATEELIENRFRKRGWIKAGQAIVADLADEVPVAGNALSHLVKSIKLVKDKPKSDNSEVNMESVVGDAKKEVPTMLRIVTKSELKRSLRELPLVDGLVNAGEAIVDNGVRKRGLIKAGQAVAADAFGEVPFVGGVLESLAKKVKLVKDIKDKGDLRSPLSEPDLITPSLNPELSASSSEQSDKINNNNGLNMQRDNIAVASNDMNTPQKSDSIPTAGNLSSHLRQLRGLESGVEKCVTKKTTLNKNYAYATTLSR